MNNDYTLDRETALQIAYRRNWLSHQLRLLNIARGLDSMYEDNKVGIIQLVINYQQEYQAIAVLLRANGHQDLINAVNYQGVSN